MYREQLIRGIRSQDKKNIPDDPQFCSWSHK